MAPCDFRAPGCLCLPHTLSCSRAEHAGSACFILSQNVRFCRLPISLTATASFHLLRPEISGLFLTSPFVSYPLSIPSGSLDRESLPSLPTHTWATRVQTGITSYVGYEWPLGWTPCFCPLPAHWPEGSSAVTSDLVTIRLKSPGLPLSGPLPDPRRHVSLPCYAAPCSPGSSHTGSSLCSDCSGSCLRAFAPAAPSAVASPEGLP